MAGSVELNVLAGQAMHPERRGFVSVGLSFGLKARLVLMHINQQALLSKSPLVEIEDSLMRVVRRIQMLKLDTVGWTIRVVKDQFSRLSAASIASAATVAAMLYGCSGGGGSSGLPPPAAPTISAQPQDQTVTAPAAATFTVTATGTAPLSYQWSKSGTLITGATSATYTTPATSSADNGATFAVEISNSGGSVAGRTATLTVDIAPSITTQPAMRSVTAPGAVTFNVAAAGTAPLSYQWSKNGAPIAGATAANYTTPATTSGTNGASYSVTVSNSFGSVTSSTALLAVFPPLIATAAPVGPILIGAQPQSQTVVTPASATFTASAIGSPPISYQWNKNGTPITGATSAIYTTPATSSADIGSTFTVTVANGVNSLTCAPAALAVTSVPTAPSIVVQPKAIAVNQGSPALLYVIATGSAPLSYQWRKNGSPIADATDATYTTTPTLMSDNQASYTVVVTNVAGNAPSAAATLTVGSTVYGLGGFAPAIPSGVDDLIGVRATFQVVTNQSQIGKIIFNNHSLSSPGSAITYNIENNVYSSDLLFANGGCTTYPPAGTATDGRASLRNATPDYPYASGQQPALGSAINTSDSINWPVQTYLIDNIANLYKSDSISQANLNGVVVVVTIQRGSTLTDVSSFQRCGLPMLSTTYRMWTITTQVSGQADVVNQVVVPDADGRYIQSYAATQFYSEFLYSAGSFAVQYWDLAYMRESGATWTPVTNFTTNWNYDGAGQDFGMHVVSVNGQDRIEFSNVPGNSYLPGNLPFAIAPP